LENRRKRFLEIINRQGIKIMSDTLKIKLIKAKDLHLFALDYAKTKDPEAIDVISIQRALAQSNNPLADENDIGLMLAYVDGKCVGYQGIMPGCLYIDGRTEKILWPTTVFISAEYRGRSIHSRLISEALSLNKPLVITGMGQMSAPIVLHLGFKPMNKAEYLEVDFRKLSVAPIRVSDKILNRLFSFFRGKAASQKDSSNLLYSGLKAVAYSVMVGKRIRSILDDIDYSEVNAIDESMESRILPKDGTFYHSLSWINWMLKYKWVLSKNEAKEAPSNYFFSNIRDEFHYIAIEINSFKNQECNSFLILSVSRDKGTVKMKVLDYIHENEWNGSIVSALVMRYAKNYHADIIEASKELIGYFNLGFFGRRLISLKDTLFVYSIPNRNSGINEEEFINVTPRFFDGDIAFV